MRAARGSRQRALPGLDAPMPRAMAAETTAHTGASTWSRDLVTWQPPRRSADADLLPNQNQLVGRSRDLERNSGIAKGGIQTVVDNVVGTGLRLNPNPNYLALGRSKAWADNWSREVRALWWSWAETTACDAADTLIFDQMTAQTLRAQLVNGDAFAIALWLPGRSDGWATKMQTIDADRLSTPAGRSESTSLRGGVQMDEYGAPLGYWVRRSHPGDYLVTGSLEGYGQWEFVPKRNAIGRRVAIHCYDKERSGQSRGKPILSSVLSNFKGLDRYTAAEIQAAVINAMVAMVIETPLDQSGIEALFRDDKAEYLKARSEHAVAIESGSTLALFPGDKATAFAPSRPSNGFGAFQENVGRIIALAYDMPYELLFKDFTKANYSSMRAAMLEAWRSFNRRRDDLGTQWADPVYMLFLEEAINAGKVEGPDFYTMPYAYARCAWIGPGRGWVDPVKEAQAAEIRIKTRISTYRDECAEQGRDWQEVMDQQATERAYADELGLPEASTGSAGPVVGYTDSTLGPDGPPDAVPADQQPKGKQPPQQGGADAIVPAGVSPEVAELRERVAGLEGGLLAAAARPSPAPEVHIHEGAMRADVHIASPPVEADSGARRILIEHEVIEQDAAGLPAVTRETYARPDAAQAPPEPELRPAPGTVLKEIVKEVIERDAEGRILRVREMEIAR